MQTSQALIQDPTALLVFFAGFVAVVFLAARTPGLDRVFRFLPPIVWVYLLPVFGTTFGITPAESSFYDWCSQYLMPASLLLLVMATDVNAIKRLGLPAAAMLLAGTVGIVVGGPVALLLFQPWLDPEMWKALGALSGSWIGGLANMVAIKEGVGAPDHLMSPVIIVDSVVGYGWMSLVILASGLQDRIDRWNRAQRGVLDELNQRLARYQAENASPITLPSFAMMIGLGFVGSYLCMRLGGTLPEIGSVLSHYTYGVLLIVIAGLALSFTPCPPTRAPGRVLRRLRRPLPDGGYHGCRRQPQSDRRRPDGAGGRRGVDRYPRPVHVHRDAAVASPGLPLRHGQHGKRRRRHLGPRRRRRLPAGTCRGRGADGRARQPGRYPGRPALLAAHGMGG